MEEAKPFWMSATLWGALFAFLGVLLPAMGFGVSASDVKQVGDSFLNIANSVLTFGGLLLTVIGRSRSTKQLTLTRK